MSVHMLAQNGHTRWRIVMAHPAHETVKLAADELQKFVMEMSDAALPVQTELVADGEYEILVGRSGRLAHYGIEADWDALGEEGYVLRSDEHYLLLAGNTPRGTLYAVYAFLEEELGCRWLSSDCSIIPRVPVLEFGDIDRTDAPAFESREAYWRDAFDGDFAVRNRMNGNKADISVRQGGRMKFYNFHHSFNDLVPPNVYFDEHPEYFSLVDGKRLKDNSQLCLSNPEVLRIAVDTVRRWIRENPDCRVFSVAQNDWRNYCTCDKCRAVDEREGTPAGSTITFVNAVADAIHDEHPDILLHTFAYQYTRKAPKYVRPRPNVIVRLCSIECCFSHPLDGNFEGELDQTAAKVWKGQCALTGENRFLTDLREWSRICSRLYIWDYVTDFANYLQPMPNFGVLQPNMRLFRDLGVKGVLEQGNYSHGGGGHLAELEAYLQAKLMWNPDCDVEKHMNDFLNGYYGTAAAPLVREYIALWQKVAERWHVGINERVTAPYITDELLDKSQELLSRALFLTVGEAERKRLKKLNLGIEYIVLQRMPETTPGRDALITRFGWECRECGVDEIHERWTLDEALNEMRRTADEEGRRRNVINDFKM